MAVRWRITGEIVCAAKSRARKGDVYIGDALSYELSVNQKVLIPDRNHKKNHLWHWLHAGDNPDSGCFVVTER